MTELASECQGLPNQVYELLTLLQDEPNFQHDCTALRASLRRVQEQRFEIVFAGAVSAGKSILINALLGRELLYSAAGHATGTVCEIAYADSVQDEKVELTFLNTLEIQQQINKLSKDLELIDWNWSNLPLLRNQCKMIINQAGGEGKSPKAIQANALNLLIDGYLDNQNEIDEKQNRHFKKNLEDGVEYVQKGSNSSILKRVEYYCHHNLLQDGNVLVDTPGIDSNSPWDANLTYAKIESGDTSAVVCVFRADSEGQLSSEETILFERIRANAGIRDRVFYVFNRIDVTLRNMGLRQKFEELLKNQFADEKRLYRTSGLFGFYGSQVLRTDNESEFGLNTILKDANGKTFINEFIAYLASDQVQSSGINLGQIGGAPEARYIEILKQVGAHPQLMEDLLKYSGISEFCTAINQYLQVEKRPQLFDDLALDLRQLCVKLGKVYQQQEQRLKQQPKSSEGLKEQELIGVNAKLLEVSDAFESHLRAESNRILETELDKEKTSSECRVFKNGLKRIRDTMLARVDELVEKANVEKWYYDEAKNRYQSTTLSIAAIVSAALESLSRDLERTLQPLTGDLVEQFFNYLSDEIHKQGYWKVLEELSIRDVGIEDELLHRKNWVHRAIEIQVIVECDRYPRESEFFYGNHPDQNRFTQIQAIAQTLTALAATDARLKPILELVNSLGLELARNQEHIVFPLEQLPKLIEKTEGYGSPNIEEHQYQAMREALKREFIYKVNKTVKENLPQVFKQTLRFHLNQMIEEQYPKILQQASKMGHFLDEQAELRKSRYHEDLKILQQKLTRYNQSVRDINLCFKSQGFPEPLKILQSELGE